LAILVYLKVRLGSLIGLPRANPLFTRMQNPNIDQHPDPTPAGPEGMVVCFGVLSYLQLMVVDQVPVHNGGTPISQLTDSYGDDSAIVAGMLRQLGQHTKFIPSAVGDDDLGRKVADTVGKLGVPVDVRIDPSVTTVAELSIADPSGARTYFYQRTPELLATLDTADLSPLESASFLYVDWYDGDHVLRAVEYASRLNIPVFLNLESQYSNKEVLAKFAPHTTVCQVSADQPESEDDMDSIAATVLEAGIGTVLITGGNRESLAADASHKVRVRAPEVEVVDGNGAGSCFSASYIYGSLRGWNLEQTVRFATAQASLKCGVAGYQVPSLAEGERLAATLQTEVDDQS